ncbi:MAG: hypothetical protein MI724_02005, partial [Spirochaetales bacterium]|nr:hypothetical protein [Spirochaetales bacterium]
LYRRARKADISLAIGPMFTLSRDFHRFLRLCAGRLGQREEEAIRVVARMTREMERTPFRAADRPIGE